MRRRFLQLLPWLAAALLLGWVWRMAPLAEAWGAVRQLLPIQLTALVMANLLALLALNGRWWLILRAQGYALPYLALVGHRLAGFGVSYFTPGPQFGGEPMQVYLLEQAHGLPRVTAVASVTLDKLLELLVNFLFLAGGVLLILQQRLFSGMVGWETAVFALFLLALPLGFLAATWAGCYPVARLLRWGNRLFLWRLRPGWRAAYQRAAEMLGASEIQATRFCQAAPWSLVAALGVSILSWALLIAEYWLMLNFLGLHLSLAQVIAMLTAARAAILLPLPGGLGTLEASQVIALRLMGLNPAAGIGASLLIRARDLTLGGVGLWWGSWWWRASRRLKLAPVLQEHVKIEERPGHSHQQSHGHILLTHTVIQTEETN